MLATLEMRACKDREQSFSRLGYGFRVDIRHEAVPDDPCRILKAVSPTTYILYLYTLHHLYLYFKFHYMYPYAFQFESIFCNYFSLFFKKKKKRRTYVWNLDKQIISKKEKREWKRERQKKVEDRDYHFNGVRY